MSEDMSENRYYKLLVGLPPDKLAEIFVKEIEPNMTGIYEKLEQSMTPNEENMPPPTISMHCNECATAKAGMGQSSERGIIRLKVNSYDELEFELTCGHYKKLSLSKEGIVKSVRALSDEFGNIKWKLNLIDDLINLFDKYRED